MTLGHFGILVERASRLEDFAVERVLLLEVTTGRLDHPFLSPAVFRDHHVVANIKEVVFRLNPLVSSRLDIITGSIETLRLC